MQQFKQGDYVVLLTDCRGNNPGGWSSIPTDHVYRLREDFSSIDFQIVCDIENHNKNGWGISKDSERYEQYVDKITVRAATQSERERCRDANDYPVPAEKQPLEPSYEVF
jgi:nitrate reductase alpha subunit